MDRKPLIGIIGAMAQEMDDIKSRIEEPQKQEIGGNTFVRGTLCGVDAVACACGIGKVFAAICAQTMILEYAPDLIINIGVSGSLTRTLNIGDIAVASEVVQHDMDTTAFGDRPGLLSGINVVEIAASGPDAQMLQQAAAELGFHVESGVIASGDVFMQDPERKKYVADTFKAISCEMEGAAIGQTCYVNGTPFCVLRAISDNGDEDAQSDYSMSLEMAADRATQVLYRYLQARRG